MPFIDLFTQEQDPNTKILEDIIHSKKSIILFGSGDGGRDYLSTLKKSGLDIVCFCDNNPNKWNTTYLSKPVLSYDTIKKEYSDAIIIISTGREHAVGINQQLINDAFYQLVYNVDLSHSAVGSVRKIIEQNCEKLEQTYYLLADDKSKKVFINKINYLLSRNIKFITSIYEPNQYFPKDIISLNSEDVFMDLGVYDGQNTLDFIKHSGNKNAIAYCFEPDPRSFEIAQHRLKDFPNVHLVPFATWEHDCELKMDAANSLGSCICEQGTTIIQAKSVDSYLAGRQITYLKMDIEGAEISTLHGAQQTLAQYNPKLAISVYHNIEDHWEIPILIHKFQPDDQIYMRHHDKGASETVCYAKK